MAQHSHKASRRTSHKALRISVSVLLSLALCVCYVCADLYSVLPSSLHILQWQSASRITVAPPRNSLHVEAVVGDQAQVPIDANLAKQYMQTLLQAQGMGTEVSVAIGDDRGEILAEHEIDTPREPASTTKTLTAFAASQVLPMDSKLETSLWLDGGQQSAQQASPAPVVLTGQGDMLLGEGASDPTHINGRAGLSTLVSEAAGQLQQRGIHAITLQYDDTMFGADRLPPDVANNSDGRLYAAPLASMAIDEGKDWSTAAKPSNPDAVSYVWSVTNPAERVAQHVASLFAASGISVEGQVQARPADQPFDANASHATKIGKVQSATLQEILQLTMQNSDNTLAQLFGRLTALATHTGNSFQADTQAVITQLQKAGITTQGVQLADCSGLSSGTRITAHTLIEIQQHSAMAGKASRVAQALAISGLNGTVVHRDFAKNLAGQIHAKTGSLSQVTSLSGYVLRTHGGTLTFAVIVNNPEHMWNARHAIDEFAGQLAQL